nr:DNA/RNA non-specific endonuclease [bacterium]
MSIYSSANGFGRFRVVSVFFALIFCFLLTGGFFTQAAKADEAKIYEVVNGNVPSFSDEELKNISQKHYSKLDKLGRCGRAQVCVGRENMPSAERGPIGQVRPSGWHTVRYDSIEDRYLYNRCHLIGYQLSGENANERNLITGTRYLNVEGMLPFENRVAHYVRATGNHVLYRVTPIFRGNDLVARGVQMEAMSVEDHGRGLKFNVFVPNVQPGISIDYATGESRALSDVS